MQHKTFPCGHRRYQPNTVGEGSKASCRTCKRVYDRARQSTIRKAQFKCGHARTPENTTMNGDRPRCRECFRGYQNRYAREHYAPRFELVSVTPRHEVETGRSYAGSGFPLKQERSA